MHHCYLILLVIVCLIARFPVNQARMARQSVLYVQVSKSPDWILVHS
jgi:hypothetical protein